MPSSPASRPTCGPVGTTSTGCGIGIDEISYRRHHRYLLVVVDHDRKRLVHAVDGANKVTVNGFFDTLGPERTAQLTHVSADGAPWLNTVISLRAP